MKSIGILVYDISLTGGAERVAINLAEELSSYYKVHLISIFNEKKQNNENNNYICYTISEETTSITKKIFMLSKKLKKYLTENNIEVLLGITAGVNGLAIVATKNTKIKTIYCEHSNLENKTYGKKHQLRQYFGAKKMDKVVTLTERDRNNFINILKTPKNKVTSITNWFNHTQTQNIPYKTESKKIITAGRLEKVKGHDLLIQVAKKVKEKHSDWIWDIYGDGKYKEEIEKNIKENKLQDFVILKGNANNLREIYNNYSFFVLTSYYEGMPLVLLEAQEANLPIVSFDCPTGPSEIVENNKNGFLIKSYDVQLMADKINELIENESKRKQFSSKAQINIDKFNKKVILDKWINLIENV